MSTRVLTPEMKLAWVNQVVLLALKKADIETTITTTPTGMRLDLVLYETDKVKAHMENVAAERQRLRDAASSS